MSTIFWRNISRTIAKLFFCQKGCVARLMLSCLFITSHDFGNDFCFQKFAGFVYYFNFQKCYVLLILFRMKFWEIKKKYLVVFILYKNYHIKPLETQQISLNYLLHILIEIYRQCPFLWSIISLVKNHWEKFQQAWQ